MGGSCLRTHSCTAASMTSAGDGSSSEADDDEDESASTPCKDNANRQNARSLSKARHIARGGAYRLECEAGGQHYHQHRGRRHPGQMLRRRPPRLFKRATVPPSSLIRCRPGAAATHRTAHNNGMEGENRWRDEVRDAQCALHPLSEWTPSS